VVSGKGINRHRKRRPKRKEQKVLSCLCEIKEQQVTLLHFPEKSSKPLYNLQAREGKIRWDEMLALAQKINH